MGAAKAVPTHTLGAASSPREHKLLPHLCNQAGLPGLLQGLLLGQDLALWLGQDLRGR